MGDRGEMDKATTKMMLESLTGQRAPFDEAPEGLTVLEGDNRGLGYSQLNELLVSSTGQRNNILKLRCRGPKVQRLSWTGVELPSDLVELFL